MSYYPANIVKPDNSEQYVKRELYEAIIKQRDAWIVWAEKMCKLLNVPHPGLLMQDSLRSLLSDFIRKNVKSNEL
jgi:hypothetical protein